MSNQTIAFFKASACGNDFLIVEADAAPYDLPALTRSMCDRHNGIGADGVEWLSSTSGANVAARLFNADGSEAEISGNGTRCVAAYLSWKNNAPNLAIRTGAGVKTCVLTARNAGEFEFETAMGAPEIGEALSLRLRAAEVRGLRLSMGNPHYVILTEAFPENWQSIGAEIQASGQFAQGVNIEFAVVHSEREIEARIFERGAGATQSSGTGSCACAVAAIVGGLAQSPVRVLMPGGPQTVRWNGEVYLRGTARLICRGEFWPL
jgi:diaminopimelate epimerase